MPEAHEKALATTQRDQGLASDPAVSAWVSANAGAGKTFVLKMRVLRLLLAGTPPERILCLTFTKAAAAEMAQRIFRDLSEWATCGDGALDESLTALLARAPRETERQLARRLFAIALETPGGLKVQTIHAFCESLLQRFPLEAGVPPGFTILDEEASQSLRREAIDAVLMAATQRQAGALGEALHATIAYAADDAFDHVLHETLGRRDWVEAISRLAHRGDPFAAAEGIYREALGLGTGSLAEAGRQLATVLPDAALARAAAVLATGSKSDRSQAEILRTACAATGLARVKALATFFLTSKGSRRERLMTNGTQLADPPLAELLQAAQHRFDQLRQEQAGHTLIGATMALWRLADAVQQRYAEAKARAASLDFEDLIARTASLLASASSTQWVLFKLDGGLDHVLVDEAQDTSRLQWEIVKALAGEFFSGLGAREEARTLFAVGDEKQSIYGFQGAEPKLFAATGETFARQAAIAGAGWRNLPLTLSFRSTEPVLACVDRVFSDHSRTPGVAATRAEVHHQAHRIGQAGLVEIWPSDAWQESPAAEIWSPLAETPAAPPPVRLANRIADTIAGWLERGEALQSEARPIRAGDILILVRKRQPFAHPMVSALKARGIPVAGSDRMRLAHQIAVEDMIALGEFLILPEDDLALATVLKSPLFGLGDDDLLAFAPGRRGTLWSALLAAAPSSSRLAPAAAALRRWRAQADFRPPYELFADLLENEGLRARLLARLGPEAGDPLDEFLHLALAYDDRAAPSLQGFLVWLRGLKAEIKRDQEHGRDEVRVMTVHGAKGLEAPIVFLPDTCSSATSARSGALLALPHACRPEGFPELCLWPVRGADHHEAIRAAKDALKQAEREERNRLLYVAMTRARDRLYIAGFETRNGREQGCWYDIIEEVLCDACERTTGTDGRPLLRLASPQTAAPRPRAAAGTDAIAPVPLPEWADRPAPREPVAMVPLAPSRIGPPETDESGDPLTPPAALPRSEPPSLSPIALAGDHRFLRGTLTHALLEHLPALDPGAQEAAARAFLASRGEALPQGVRAGIVAEVMAILREPELGALFGPGSRAEVAIAAEISHPDPRRPALRITGQIDRLVRLPHEIIILDYKTNRPPPREPAAIAPAYLAQLAAYRLGVAAVFGARSIRAAILWTDGPRIMPVPSAFLDAAEADLWAHGGTRLDAP